MQAEQIFTNARVVSSSEVLLGTVAVRDGQIHDVSPGGSQLPQAQDLEGDYLMPGLIELHTDNLEKYMNPRQGVDWPSESPVLAHDAQLVSAGIATAFAALAIGEVNPNGNRLRHFPIMLQALPQAKAHGHTLAAHHLHPHSHPSPPKTREIYNK